MASKATAASFFCTTIADDSDGARAQHDQFAARSIDVASRTTERRDVELTLDEVVAALQPAVAAFGGIDPPVELTIRPNPSVCLSNLDVSTEQMEVACSISMASDVFQAVLDGESSLMESLLEGNIEVEGDSSAAIAMQGLSRACRALPRGTRAVQSPAGLGRRGAGLPEAAGFKKEPSAPDLCARGCVGSGHRNLMCRDIGTLVGRRLCGNVEAAGDRVRGHG